MSFNQPRWWSRFATFSDSTLPHQIKIVTDSRLIYVTCNCVPENQVIGATESVEDSWRQYKEFHNENQTQERD